MPVSDHDFVAIWNKCGGSPVKVAKELGVAERNVYRRRKSLERRLGHQIKTHRTDNEGITKINYRNIAEGITGPVIVFSDLHAWPGDNSPAFFACLKLIKELKPRLIVNNGDAFDGATISRHPPMGFLELPTVEQELSYCKELLTQVERAAPKGCQLIWCAGNHDTRFAARLASHAPEFVKVQGFDFKDHFPAWQWGWSLAINPGTSGETWVKHRWRGGDHASHNNVMRAGVNIVTGHTHALKAVPFTDYKGRRWGVETGCLSPIGLEAGDKFTYAEDNPGHACQGFVVLNFTEDYKLLPPELVETIDGAVYWRGKRIYG